MVSFNQLWSYYSIGLGMAKRFKDEKCYECLGVSHNATLEEIKEAYHGKAKEVHPDLNNNKESKEFVRLSHCYKILKDEKERDEYDLQLRHGKKGNCNFERSRPTGPHRPPPPNTPPFNPPYPPPRPTPAPVPSPMEKYMDLAVRAAWFIGMIGAFLILIRIDQAVFAKPNFLKVVFFGGLDLAVVLFGLKMTFGDNDLIDLSEPVAVGGTVASAIVLVIVGAALLSAHSGTTAQSSSGGQQSIVSAGSQEATNPAVSASASSTANAGSGSSASDSSPASSVSTGWSSGQQVDSPGSSFTSVSCPTASFCLMVDNVGTVYSYSTGTQPDGPEPDTDGNGFTDVSCADANFCAAITSGATAYIYDNGTWLSSSLANGAANLTAVSCPAVGYCVATGDWYSYTYSDGSWEPGEEVQDQNNLIAISCPTTSFCMATDDAGNAYIEDSSGSWSAAQPSGDGGYRLTAISCPSANFCAAIASSGTVYTYDNGNWSSSSPENGAANLTAISCPAVGYCVATGDWYSYTYSDGSWEPGVFIQKSSTFVSLSCPTVGSCVAVDSNGKVYTYTAN